MIHLLVSAPPRRRSVIPGCRLGEPGVIHPGLGSAARGVMTIGGSGFFLIYLWYGRKRWVYGDDGEGVNYISEYHRLNNTNQPLNTTPLTAVDH